MAGPMQGFSVCFRTAAECLRANIRVDGVILDSPFHSLKDMFEGNQGFMSKVLSVALDADKLIKHMKVEFNSPKWLSNLKIPVTVFVAESDPVSLGYRFSEKSSQLFVFFWTIEL